MTLEDEAWSGPRQLADRDRLDDRRRHVFDPHVEPLNRWVDRLRSDLAGVGDVPWFDPADGGTTARILWLSSQPDGSAVSTSGGSGFASADNEDQHSTNLWITRNAAGVERTTTVLWNAVPYLPIGGNDDDVEAPDLTALLAELLALLPELRSVVLAGKDAASVWQQHAPIGHGLEVITTQAPGARDLTHRPSRHNLLTAAWNEAQSVSEAPLPTRGTVAPLRELEPANDQSPAVVYQPISETEIVAFGAEADIADLGLATSRIPEPMTRQVRAAAASLPGVATALGEGGGQVVRLTKESVQLLRQNETIGAGGKAFYGIVRDPNTKQFAGQLTFTSVGRMGAVASNLPNVLGAVAMQQQMAAIEAQLASIQESLDELIEDRQVELEAGLSTNLTILANVYDTSARRGELSDADWQRLAVAEPRVRDFHTRTRAAIDTLIRALDPEHSMASKTKQLGAALRDDDTMRNLRNLVNAELALTQWESLHLLHEIQHHPEETAELTERTLSELRSRHHQLVALARSIDTFLSLEGPATALRDRLRILDRRKLDSMRSELYDVLGTYQSHLDVLGLEAPPQRSVASIPSLSMGQQLGDAGNAARHVAGSGAKKLRNLAGRASRHRSRDE